MQTAIAPVFLISAVGVLLSAMSVRYGRVIDRMRTLLDLLGHPLPAQFKREDFHAEVRSLYKRARLLRTTIIFAALCIFCIVLTIIIMFAELTVGIPSPVIPQVFFSAALLVLLISVALFINDFAISLHFFKHEIRSRLSREEYEMHHSQHVGDRI